MAETEKSTTTLVRDLTNQYTQLVRDEFALVRAEMNEKVSRAGSGATMLVAGAIFGLCALLILLLAVVIVLANVVAPWLAAVIVGVAALIIALIAVSRGRSQLRAARPVPDRTIASVSTDARFTKEQVR